MARGLWTGNISFGLVTIPVSVVSAENKQQEVSFDLIDRRDHARVGYQKINKSTGEVIDADEIVKGLKLDSGKYAIFEEDEIRKLRIEGSTSIDIHQFIGIHEVAPIFFKKSYYLEAGKNGDKVYLLLRDALGEMKKYAVGLIVLHNRQQLALIGTHDDALLLYTLHYAHELKSTDVLNLPKAGKKNTKITTKEIEMTERLVEEMTSPWEPEQYKDHYYQQVMAATKRKSRRKVEIEAPVHEASHNVVDLLPLLQKSLRAGRKASSKHAGHHHKAVRG